MQVKIKLLKNYKFKRLPEYATSGSSGVDLLAATEQKIIIKPKEWKSVPTGISVEIPEGYEMEIRPRSGLALNYGISVLNSPGTIDSDYRGEIKVILINHSRENFTVKKGMRIAQGVLKTVEKIEFKKVKKLSKTMRSAGGFGHTN
jgi:dUTP pyrophosphatase